VSADGARSLSIRGPAGPLEALLEETAGETPRLIAVICHPHPLYGGTLHNKVVHTLARGLRAGGAACLRFNFRGVGASAGTHDGGTGETADALAAVGWLRERWPDAGLILAGFSFGAAIAIRAADAARPRWLICVAPAVDRVDAAGPEPVPEAWLIIQGEADDVVNPEAVARWAARHAPQARLRALPGAGHFFHGKLHLVLDCLREEWPVALAS